MISIGLLLLYLAIRKGFEPLLLVPIGFGGILANIPGAGLAYSAVENALHAADPVVLGELAKAVGLTVGATAEDLGVAYQAAGAGTHLAAQQVAGCRVWQRYALYLLQRSHCQRYCAAGHFYGCRCDDGFWAAACESTHTAARCCGSVWYLCHGAGGCGFDVCWADGFHHRGCGGHRYHRRR